MLGRSVRWLCGLSIGVCLSGLSSAAAQTPAVRAAEAAIMQADRDFNRAVADGSRERFAALIVATAVFNGGTPDEARGRDAIVKSWSPFFEAAGPRLTWEPTSAHVLVGADVGVTIGAWLRKTTGTDGRIVERRGQYLTTWLKQPDGRWLVSADIGSAAN
jgi:uncharacterized protein (TIGR02246 family)